MSDATGSGDVAPLLSGRRRAVLFTLRRAGQATVDELADALAMTVSGARQHLAALADQGLVVATEVPRPAGQRGRPALAYEATELADALFPKAYANLTNELLGYLDEEATDIVDRLFARRRETRIAAARERLARRRSFGAKVEELAQILDEDGYLATVERVDADRFRVVEHNCAIFAVAQRYGQACSSEIEFIRAVLPEASVERTHHMVGGDRHCGYVIERRR
jgi:predicted ArsR family transcriptional regulator